VELLVVISIMGLLMSILLPSLSRAREQSRQVVCRNNLRCIWTGIRMYSLEFRDRVPYIEDYGDDADPFNPKHPNAVGTVLESYVVEGSWVCPAANRGIPNDAPGGDWKLTYEFRTAGPAGDPKTEPYDVDIEDNEKPFRGGPKYLSNYAQFDGRPIEKVNGRRYVTSPSAISTYEPKYNRWWAGREPLFNDLYIEEGDALGNRVGNLKPRYPHRGTLEGRRDLKNYRDYYESRPYYKGQKTGYLGLFADGTQVETFFTRSTRVHAPGY
jgi:type II secretory pathway pseudopilin PulG